MRNKRPATQVQKSRQVTGRRSEFGTGGKRSIVPVDKKVWRRPDWSGVDLTSDKQVEEGGYFEFDGYKYCTTAERELAVLLKRNDIAFTPDVKFRLVNDGSEKPDCYYRIYTPDFIFNKAGFFWVENSGFWYVIHGIEAKGNTTFYEMGGRTDGCSPIRRMFVQQRLLYEQRGIRVIAVTNAEIWEFVRQDRLPIVLRP
jgi:hypothetical protein